MDSFEKNVLFIFCEKCTDRLKAILREGDAVDVYLGAGGDHQDDFLREDRPKGPLKNSIVTPSLEAAIINGKYVNALSLDCIEQKFSRNGLSLSKQTMSNWIIHCTERYLIAIYERIL